MHSLTRDEKIELIRQVDASLLPWYATPSSEGAVRGRGSGGPTLFVLLTTEAKPRDAHAEVQAVLHKYNIKHIVLQKVHQLQPYAHIA